MISQQAKLSNGLSSKEWGNYKRTRQGALAALLLYIYYYIVVHATTMCLPHVHPPCFYLMFVRRGSHWGGSPQNGLRNERTCGTTLASAYVLCRLSAAWSQLQMKERESEWEWVLNSVSPLNTRDWVQWEFISIVVDYQTSELQCNY